MASIRDVAREAQVSVATASRVLSRADYPVRTATRARVIAAAEYLGYRQNALARGLRHGSSNAIGICATALSNLTAMSAVEGVSERLEDFGRPVQTAVSRWDPGRERAAIDLFLEERLAGVLSFPTVLERDAYLRLQAAGVPAVFLNRTVPGVPAPVVRHDFAAGYRGAVETLAADGHRRIAALLASYNTGKQAQILRGHAVAWSAALERVGLEPNPDWQLPTSQGLDPPRVRRMLSEILAAPHPPTALFCGLLPTTVAVLQALDDLGLRVPTDIAVVGTTDHHWRPLVPRRVPAVVLNSHRLGSTAAELLQELITTGRVTDDSEVIIGVTLEQGSDTARLSDLADDVSAQRDDVPTGPDTERST